jgi:hypothetical protein
MATQNSCKLKQLRFKVQTLIAATKNDGQALLKWTRIITIYKQALLYPKFPLTSCHLLFSNCQHTWKKSGWETSYAMQSTRHLLMLVKKSFHYLTFWYHALLTTSRIYMQRFNIRKHKHDR